MKNNIKHSAKSAIEMFLQGEEVLRKQHQERERSKIGILRVGNAGCMIDKERCIGASPQTTLARFLGYQLPSEASQAYFDGGIDNETVWETNLRAAGIAFKREEEIPVVHTLPCGTQVTGRPDIVTGVGNFTPELMLELKASQATKSSAEKLYLEKPSTEHLIQASTYSMFLGIPAILVYTSNVSGGINNWWTKKEVGDLDATFGKIEFKLGWEDGHLYYMKGGLRVETVVTQQGILDYYSNIVKMARERKPNLIYQADVDIQGDMLPYNPRKYNDLINLVDDDLPFGEWLAKVQLVCKQDYLIKYRTKRGKEPWYEVIHPTYFVEGHRYYKEEKLIKEFTSLNSARKFIYGP